MEFDRSIIGKAMGMLDMLRTADKPVDGKPAVHPTRRARGTGWQRRVADGKKILENPPGK